MGVTESVRQILTRKFAGRVKIKNSGQSTRNLTLDVLQEPN